HPTALPDGRIGFTTSRDGKSEIYVMNADGSGATDLSANPPNEHSEYPDWSPDGSRIVYRHRALAGDDVWVMNADGSGKTNLTKEPGTYKYNPVWSPDGARIAYESAINSVAVIGIMNANGSAKITLPPDNDFGEHLFDWRPLAGSPPPPPTTTTTTIPPSPPVEPSATFAPTVTYPTGQYNPWHVAVADFNRDGKQDLAVASPFGAHPETGVSDGDPEGEVVVLLGIGDGTFGPPAGLYAGFAPRSLAVGDFNEDGAPDLAVGNSGGRGTRDVSLLLGAGDGSFAPPVFYDNSNAVGRPHMVVVDDMNGDGFDDVVVSNFERPPSYAEVSVLLGTGTGTLLPAARPHPTGSGTTSVATGDFNEDGIRDLVTTNLLQQDMSVLLGTGGGDFGPATYFRSGGINPE
ncbi:MAG: FG-GAP-like repeat-containing protein, partial [Actinobacteria bacterium]|nr:FG-GAP-like repeat-containing protein [Actinomycetota bacterium]